MEHYCKWGTYKYEMQQNETKAKRNQLKQNKLFHKFAFSQIIQDGLEFQIPDTICQLDFPNLSRLIPPPPICQYDRTINDSHKWEV